MATRNDGELGSLYWLSFIFGGVLLFVDIFYSAWHTMPEGWRILGYFINGVCAALIALIFIERNNPNFDYCRKIFCVVAVAGFLYVGGWRVGSNENKMMQDDINKAKQEQTK